MRDKGHLDNLSLHKFCPYFQLQCAARFRERSRYVTHCNVGLEAGAGATRGGTTNFLSFLTNDDSSPTSRWARVREKTHSATWRLVSQLS